MGGAGLVDIPGRGGEAVEQDDGLRVAQLHNRIQN
jgi:hypothetical protein